MQLQETGGTGEDPRLCSKRVEVWLKSRSLAAGAVGGTRRRVSVVQKEGGGCYVLVNADRGKMA